MKKWKCASIVPFGQVHERRRAVHEAGGDEEGGDAAVPRHAGERQAGQRHRHLERRVAGAEALGDAVGEQGGHVEAEDPAQQQVPPAERLVVEGVAAREVVTDEGDGSRDHARAGGVGRRRLTCPWLYRLATIGPSPQDSPRRTAVQPLAHERTF